jgi:hypothetical protein
VFGLDQFVLAYLGGWPWRRVLPVLFFCFRFPAVFVHLLCSDLLKLRWLVPVWGGVFCCLVLFLLLGLPR